MNGLRVCGSCLSEDDLISVTDKYLHMMSTCFSIQIADVAASKEFQQMFICDVCVKRLNDSYSFRSQILDSQTKLKNLIFLSDKLQMESEDGIFKTEYLIEEDLQSNIDGAMDTDLDLFVNYKEDSFTPDAIVTENESKQEKTKIKTTPTEKTNKNKKTERSTSSERLLQYKRLSNRYRYAEAIPFKLDKSALACELCNESFSTHKFLVSHMAIHYPNYICDLCGKSFVLRIHLVGHIKTHDVEKISCAICSKLLKKSSMTRHLKTHTGNNNSYACPHCTERFISFNTRVKHMEKMHNIDIHRYHCKICSKKFHLASSLSKHVRRCHFQELNVTCEECGKGFFDKKSLVEHMLKHTGERNHRCTLCPKSYVRKCSLREHLKTHVDKIDN